MPTCQHCAGTCLASMAAELLSRHTFTGLQEQADFSITASFGQRPLHLSCLPASTLQADMLQLVHKVC